MYLGARAALYAGTSLAWWGVDVPEPSVAEFLVPRGRRRLDNDLVVHTTERWERRDLLRHDGVQLTSATRAIIDLASTGVTAKVLETAIDSAVRLRRTSYVTLARRIGELAGPGRHGVTLLRALMLDSGGESFLERRFLRLLRTHALPRPQCQMIHEEDGRVKRVDFEFPGTRVVVEVSGRLGHVTDRERQKDARRRNALQQAGLLVLEFTTADVLDDAPYVATTLRRALGLPVSPLSAVEGTVRATQAGQVA
jgi:very-short-patch-repair endonuclease